MIQISEHCDESKSLDDDDKINIDSGDESDGKGALRQVEAGEKPRAAWHGPSNASLQHFHEPTPIIDRSGQKHVKGVIKWGAAPAKEPAEGPGAQLSNLGLLQKEIRRWRADGHKYS